MKRIYLMGSLAMALSLSLFSCSDGTAIRRVKTSSQWSLTASM